jgi:hypothetical protein
MQTIADTEYANEIDPDAPYGRKKNGQPYKTKPSMRSAIKNYKEKHKEEIKEYSRKYYQENPEKAKEYCLKWTRKNADKHRQNSLNYYYKKRMELEYFKELFQQGLREV